MADIDTLPKRGIPARALVDGLGIAVNGSQTVAQLAARGIRAECAVDVTGVSTSGANMLQIVQRGIRAFCPVSELGIAQDASTTADTLRSRGIRPAVLLDANGIALNGSANRATLAQRGLQSFCPLDEAGNATTMGAVILISNSTVLDNVSIGTNVGVLSVAGGTGTYTFTLTSNPGTLFATAGTNGVNLNTAAALTAGDKPITVQAAGGVPTPISRALIVTVAPSPTLPVNTVLPVVSGSTVVGQTLTTTDGTWTGFPAPGFTYQWNRVPTASAEVTAFLARTSGLDATHTNAYTALIDGLVADGVWAKCDAIYIQATSNSTTALLNLISPTYNSTIYSTPPTFTANWGFTGVSGTTIVLIETHFSPVAAPSPKFTRNSAHISFWSALDVAPVDRSPMGLNNSGGGYETQIHPRYADNNAYFRVNSTNISGVSVATSKGFYLANRPDANTVQGYKDATSIFTNSSAPSVALIDYQFYLCAQNTPPSGNASGSPHLISAATIGSSLTPTEVTNLYNRLLTYITTVGVPSAEAAVFLARTSGLDATHTNAYTALINGLVADGIWSKFDILRIYATQDSTNALLNLVSTSYPAVLNGSPAFTADRGFTGVDASNTVYIQTLFNPSTAPSPKYTQNSAHISAWNVTNGTSSSSGGVFIGVDSGATRQTNILPRYSDGNAYFRINSDTGNSGQSVSNANSTGHYISNRSASNAAQAYRNGSSILTNSNVSTAVPANNILDLANGFSSANTGAGFQMAASSVGSSLNGTEALAFYNRLRTYMTAVGVP